MPTTMDQDSQTSPQTTNQTQSATVIRRSAHRRLLLRRRKLPVVRLGSKKPRRGLFLVRVFRRIRLRWLKLHYACTLKKLKKYYSEVIKDMKDACATLESFQQRIFMETTLGVPVMGVSLSSFPSVLGSDRPRSHMFM